MNCMQFRNPSKQEDVGTDGEHLKGFLRSGSLQPGLTSWIELSLLETSGPEDLAWNAGISWMQRGTLFDPRTAQHLTKRRGGKMPVLYIQRHLHDRMRYIYVSSMLSSALRLGRLSWSCLTNIARCTPQHIQPYNDSPRAP